MPSPSWKSRASCSNRDALPSGPPALCRHDNARGSDHVLAQPVAELIDRDHGAAGGPTLRPRGAGAGVVQSRAERPAARRERLDATTPKPAAEVPAPPTHALQQRVL